MAVDADKCFMFKITNVTRGTIVGDKIELADTSITRMFGLLGRPGLDAGGGLWIKPSSGVHTFGMSFSIDVVSLDHDLRILKLWRCLKPFRITSVSLKFKSVLELPCGTIAGSELAIGDQLHASPSSQVEEINRLRFVGDRSRLKHSQGSLNRAYSCTTCMYEYAALYPVEDPDSLRPLEV